MSVSVVQGLLSTPRRQKSNVARATTSWSWVVRQFTFSVWAILISFGLLDHHSQILGQSTPPDSDETLTAIPTTANTANSQLLKASGNKLSAAIDAARNGNRERAAALADEIPTSLNRNSAYRAIAAAIQSNSSNTERNKKPPSALGGGTQADFGPLINLITSTISPDTWDANGGQGAAVPFPAGILIDSRGVLQRTKSVDSPQRVASRAHQDTQSGTAERLRMVSLPRLERVILRHILAGQPLPDIVWKLAGLQRISHVVVDAEHHDLILAGPYDESDPVLRLDDLLVLYQNAQHANGQLGCSIEPRRENLAQTQAFLQVSNRTPLPAGERQRWQEELQQKMGRQDILIEGVSHSTRVARILVAADYHMKLIGMGIEPGGPNVPSYLESFTRKAQDPGQPMDVLRWWFTLDYDAVRFNTDQHVYQIEGDGVRVLSESELLNEKGDRVHTGHSTPRNAAFARAFSDNYMSLCETYPVYRQFLAICDLSMACAIIEQERLAEHCKWSPQWWESPILETIVPREWSPREVDTVVNYVKLSRNRFVTGVSGGVSLDTAYELTSKRQPLDAQNAIRITAESNSPTSYEAEQRWYW